MAFTIDTGATKTVISERINYSIQIYQRPILKQTKVLTDATGQACHNLGRQY